MRARQTARYEAALAELTEHAGLQCIVGPAGFCAWERLNALVVELKRRFDAYELEGDVAPVRQAIERYLSDLAAMQHRPDPWVTAHLGRFLEQLEDETPTVLEIETSREAPQIANSWPDGLLTISAEELSALHGAFDTRTSPHAPPGA